jgi:phosphoribosylanthranilate isomerase
MTPVGFKACGLTRPQDADAAARVGASHAGVVFAGGPRHQSPTQAAAVLAALPAHVTGVGVFGRQSVDEIVATLRVSGARVAQLHADPTVDDVEAVRRAGAAEVWAVVRVAGAQVPETVADLARAADAIVFDAKVDGRLGGAGVALPWAALAQAIAPWRRGRRIVLAGGLTPTNVGTAIRALTPDIVDVSSGIESSPGIKDHDRLRAFADEVRGAASLSLLDAP